MIIFLYFTISKPANMFPNKRAPNIPNNALANSPFCSFTSFLTVSLTSFINKPDSSCVVAIFIISLIYSLEGINVVIPDPTIFLQIAASVTDADVVNANGIKTLLANGLSTFFLKGKPVFS